MKVRKRRRRENKTNYHKRLKLLKSGKPRLVVRKTNKYINIQYISSEDAKDKVEIGVSSKDLMKHGWPEKYQGSLKSTTAAYLIGYLIGNKVIKEKKEQPIVDLGMYITIPKNKFYGLLKGLIDSGLSINCEEEKFPEEDRIMGKNMKEDFSQYFEKIKSNIAKE